MKNGSIFKNTFVITILSILGSAITTLIIDWFKAKDSELPLLSLIITASILFVFILYQIDVRKEWKKLNENINYIKEKIDMLINMNKKGQYESLRLFLILFIIFLMIFYVIYNVFLK